jgi:hypothetical protein
MTDNISLIQAVKINDPGYMLLNWIGSNHFGGIYFVNTVCALILVLGLFCFCYKLPNKYLGLACAFPYLIIVVGMGYTRQAAALGFVFLLILQIHKKSFFGVFMFLLLASAFHKSAVIMSPALFLIKTNKWSSIINLMVTPILIVIIYYSFFADYLSSLIYGYLENTYSSSGALIRSSMSVFVALIFLTNYKKMELQTHYQKYWAYNSFITIVALGGILALESTTFIDRIGLYLIPLQLLVLNHLPNIFKSNVIFRRYGSLLVIIYSWAVFLVWYFLSANSIAWKQYQLYPFVDMF